MDVKQIYGIMNTVTQEILGESQVLNEDLSNIVDIGTEIFNANAVDRYVKSLVNQIGRIIFVDRVYRGSVPSVLRDGWEYGSVLMKIQADLPKATENESWELEDGQSYDQNIFYKPSVSAKFYNSKVTFEIAMSFTELQVKQSLQSREQLNGFLSMLYNSVDKSMTVKMDALVMRTINAFMGEIIHSEYAGVGLNTKSGVRAINLLYLFNQLFPRDTPLTQAKMLTDKEFIRFATYQIALTSDRMTKISTLHNVGGKERFTPKDMQNIVMLADFAKAADTWLQSDTFHDNYTKLPNAETVPYWQGSGTAYALTDVSSINIMTPSNDEVSATGILCTIFDRDALGVANLDRRTTTHYNAKAEFFNNYNKMDAGYWIDLNEQGVVFFGA